MKLELGKIFIHDVQFADRTYVRRGHSMSAGKIMIWYLRMTSLVSAEVELRPGESMDCSGEGRDRAQGEG